MRAPRARVVVVAAMALVAALGIVALPGGEDAATPAGGEAGELELDAAELERRLERLLREAREGEAATLANRPPLHLDDLMELAPDLPPTGAAVEPLPGHWRPEQDAELRRRLAAMAPFSRALMAAVEEAGRGGGSDTAREQEEPASLAASRLAANVLAAQIVRAARDGEDDQAAARLHLVGRVLRWQPPRHLISLLIGSACETILVASCGAITQEHGVLPAGLARSLRRFAALEPWRQRVRLAIRGELASCRRELEEGPQAAEDQDGEEARRRQLALVGNTLDMAESLLRGLELEESRLHQTLAGGEPFREEGVPSPSMLRVIAFQSAFRRLAQLAAELSLIDHDGDDGEARDRRVEAALQRARAILGERLEVRRRAGGLTLSLADRQPPEETSEPDRACAHGHWFLRWSR